MSNLFDQIDTTGSGTITKSQFEQAFQNMNPPGSFQAAGADAVWSKLDPNGTGSVSKQDFVNGMTTMMKQLRGHHHGGSVAGAQSVTQTSNLLAALDSSTGSSSPTASNTSSAGSILDLLA